MSILGQYWRYEKEIWRELWSAGWKGGKAVIAEAIVSACGLSAHWVLDQPDLATAALVIGISSALLLALHLCAAVAVASFSVWQKQRRTIRDRDRRIRQIRITKPTQAGLDGLARFLDEGIHEILNRPIQDVHGLEGLVEFERGYNERLFAHLDEHFPISDAMLVKRLGTITPRVFPGFHNDVRHRILSQFSRREELMRMILARPRSG